jgi:N4-gp56 family major capsid protein
MAWTTTTSLVADVDDSVVTEWDKAVLLGYTPELVCEQVASVKVDMNAKTHQFTKFSNLSLISSALSEDADATSVVMVDAAITLTPAEYGNVITYGKLSSYQTGGKADLAAAALVGRNMGASVDKLGIAALEAFTTTVIFPNAITAVTSLTADDVLDLPFANRLYNKLARLNVPGIGANYIGIAHDDCLHDLRADMVSVLEYARPEQVLNNEVGMAGGIRWLRSSNVSVTTDGGAGTVDSYKVNVVGQNALGLAICEAPHPTMTGPFDKLGRFVNIGWYGLFKWGTVDTANMVQGGCASSVGTN